LAQSRHELARAMRLKRAGWIVQQHARRAERRQLARLLDQRGRLTGTAGAVDETGLELRSRVRNRGGRPAQVRDVVQPVVETEDVDAVRGGGGDEPANEVVVRGARADEKAAAEREAERCRRASLQRADALPRALDAAANGAVEAAASRHLEVGEARAVQDLGDAKLIGGRQSAGAGVLAAEAGRRGAQ